MATTVRKIVKAALRKLEVIGIGETLPDDDARDVHEALTTMVDDWSLESMLVPVVDLVTIDLVNDTTEYTIGIYPAPVPNPLPSNHKEKARPQQILTAFIRDASGTDYPLEPMPAEQYASISTKTTGARPSRYYVRKGWPLNRIIFDSAPVTGDTLHMEVILPLAEVLPTTALTTEINLPPGYENPLIFNLAINIAPEYGKTPSQVVVARATDGLKKLKRSNYRPITSKTDRAVSASQRGNGTYSITQGP